jgi:hypothetical protein
LNGEVYAATIVDSGNYGLGLLFNMEKVSDYPSEETVAEFEARC